MEHSVIVTAGGTGKRMGAGLPKQFLPLAGKPVLMHTLQRFYDFDPEAQLILSLPEASLEYWQELCDIHHFNVPHIVVPGGEERYHSIRNALEKATGKLIAVHDGVRPLVSRETIRRCFEKAAETGAAVPVVPVSESLRELNGTTSRAVLRADYRIVQTPQVFRAEIVHRAYEQPYHEGITDDASLVEESGVPISLVEGNVENIKLTTPSDLLFAEMLLGAGN